MTVEWPANYFSATLEDDVWLVAFADTADEPEHYLLLQRSTECDESSALFTLRKNSNCSEICYG